MEILNFEHYQAIQLKSLYLMFRKDVKTKNKITLKITIEVFGTSIIRISREKVAEFSPKLKQKF